MEIYITLVMLLIETQILMSYYQALLLHHLDGVVVERNVCNTLLNSFGY
jgi:hypothetical protein